MLDITSKQELFYKKHLKTNSHINFLYHMSYTWRNKILFVCSILALGLMAIIYFSTNEYICIVLILIILVWVYGYFMTDSIIITDSNIYIYKVPYNKLVDTIDLDLVYEVEHYKNNDRLAVSLYDGTNKSYNVRLNQETFAIIESIIAIHKEEAMFILEEEFKNPR